MPLALKDLHATWRGDDPNWVHKCQNCKLAHTHFGLEKDVLELCPRSFDVFLQVGFVVENPKPKQQVEQGLNMDRINEINDWFWNPV